MTYSLLARLHPGSLVSSPALWGKLPSRGDFIRFNLKHREEDALQTWVSARRDALSNCQPDFSGDGNATTGIGHHGVPWCFVLSPGRLAFNPQHFVLGVWMESADKIGRDYPLLMFQKASAQWVEHYFALHTQTPCDWLFYAARTIANAVYAKTIEQAPTQLTSALSTLWRFYAPDWRILWTREMVFPDKSLLQAKGLLGASVLDDRLETVEGVRYLPWSDWPARLAHPYFGKRAELFWQQNTHGRFIGAMSTDANR
jgi:type VI secretion system protein ImpM